MSTGQHVPFRAFNPYGEVRIARRRLPHWRQPGVSYLVTFRLADSSPQALLRQWRNERGIWLRLHPQPWSAHVRDAKELTAFRNYIAGNPAKAGLKPDKYSLQLSNVLTT